MQRSSLTLHDSFNHLGVVDRGSKPQTPTVDENTDLGDDENAHRGGSSEGTAPNKPWREKLDSLSAFRIRPSEIKFTSSEPHGRGVKADVAQATFRRGGGTDGQLVAVKKHRYFLRIDRKKFANEFIHEVEVMIKDTFGGVKYLYSRRLLFAMFNILVSASLRAGSTDFGSARAIIAPENEVMIDESGQRVQGNPTMEQDCASIHVDPTHNQLNLTGPA
ncbi:hypothetical protein M407DRAFT_28122 [Tulasnella calospora MUT 4182]|uniref:Uncharacterized protein n=1 Tax=Tulasnella calospora MUT 4182 TaxID=1051891 RepID=A0A0C3QCL6_9AGAM|nr:hypothetical protein M407DRAFT_28122 [Tulasnella calospora MUT 4182]